jgi:hypothetical protein
VYSDLISISRKKISAKLDQAVITDRLYDQALQHYEHKNKAAADKSYPIVLDVYKTRGGTFKDILVPFTDGIKQIGVAAELKKCVDYTQWRVDQIHGEDDYTGHHRSKLERTPARYG